MKRRRVLRVDRNLLEHLDSAVDGVENLRRRLEVDCQLRPQQLEQRQDGVREPAGRVAGQLGTASKAKQAERTW